MILAAVILGAACSSGADKSEQEVGVGSLLEGGGGRPLTETTVASGGGAAPGSDGGPGSVATRKDAESHQSAGTRSERSTGAAPVPEQGNAATRSESRFDQGPLAGGKDQPKSAAAPGREEQAPAPKGLPDLAPGRGVTDTEIAIGARITTNLGPALAIVGGGKHKYNDEEQVVNGIVNYLNKTGGIAGRKVKLLVHKTDVARGTWASQDAEACADFVQDHAVLAVTDGHVGGSDALGVCLARGKTPYITQKQWPFDNKYYDELSPYLYQPSRMRPERWAPALVDGLNGAGYFAPQAKVGIVRFDAPVFTRIAALIKDRLKAVGHPASTEITITTPPSVSDFGSMSNELNSAILRLRTEGITHVIFDEYSGIIPFFMLQQAESQGYRPRYAFNSTDIMQVVQLTPPAQLHGSVGVSWVPGQDVNPSVDPRPQDRGALGLCNKIMRDAGVKDPQPLYTQLHCDSWFFLKAAIERAGAVINTDTLRSATERLGTSYDSPFTFATDFGPGRFDGAAGAGTTQYDDACQCFKFQGATRLIGPAPRVRAPERPSTPLHGSADSAHWPWFRRSGGPLYVG